MGHPGPLLFRNCGKHLVGHSKVPPHYRSLVLQDGDQQGVADNVELLVSQVQTVIFGYLTQQVHCSVQVSNSDNLSSYIVVESVDRAGVDETVSDPESSFHDFLDLSLDLEC